MTDRVTQTLRNAKNKRLFVAFAVVIFTLLLYAPALNSAFLRDDDLAAVTTVRSAGSWIGFSPLSDGATTWYPDQLYRPLFAVQTWTLHQLFYVNYAGYQIVLVLALCLAAVALTRLLLQIGLAPLVAGLLALFFVSHPFVSPLAIWVSDVAVWQYTLVALCALLLMATSGRQRDYLFLALLFLAAALLRENGLALVVAAVVLAVLAWRDGYWPRRRVGGVTLMAMLSVLVYFTLRTYAVGLLPDHAPAEDAGIFFTNYTPTEVAAFSTSQRLLLSAYTVGANLVASFLPIIRGTGYLRASSWQILGLSAAIFITVLLAGRGGQHWNRAWFRPLQVVLLAAGAVVLFALLRNPSTNAQATGLLEIASFSIHGALSALILLTLFRQRKQIEDKPLIGFALVLIVVAGALAFAYFRNRNLYLPFLGWLLLLALALANRGQVSMTAFYQQAIVTLVGCAIMINSVMLFTGLPLPEMRAEDTARSAPALCDSRASDEVIRDVALFYDIPLDEALRCRGSQ